MDVTTAFLNGELDEELYMCQPEGYVTEGQEHLVCKLKQNIYGLKQSSRCWNSALDYQRNHCSEKFKSDHRGECFIVVQTMLLRKTLSHELGLVTFNRSIRISLKLKYHLHVLPTAFRSLDNSTNSQTPFLRSDSISLSIVFFHLPFSRLAIASATVSGSF